jgi:hypothetical protein
MSVGPHSLNSAFATVHTDPAGGPTSNMLLKGSELPLPRRNTQKLEDKCSLIALARFKTVAYGSLCATTPQRSKQSRRRSRFYAAHTHCRPCRSITSPSLSLGRPKKRVTQLPPPQNTDCVAGRFCAYIIEEIRWVRSGRSKKE